MPVSRATIRKQLASLLRGVLTSDTGPAVAVYDHQVANFDGQSPVVVVSSAGSDRQRLTMQGGLTKFYLNVDVFTLYTAAAAEDGESDDTDNADDGAVWTTADAEDTVDAIEQHIAAIIERNQRPTGWDAIGYADRTSTASIEDLGGTEYKRELIPLVVTVYG